MLATLLVTALLTHAPALAAPRTANVQCDWNQPVQPVQIDLPALSDCKVEKVDAADWSLVCNKAVTLTVNGFTYVSSTSFALAGGNASLDIGYAKNGFAAMTNGQQLNLTDGTGFTIVLSISSASDGRSLQPYAVQMPNVRNACSVNWR